MECQNPLLFKNLTDVLKAEGVTNITLVAAGAGKLSADIPHVIAETESMLNMAEEYEGPESDGHFWCRLQEGPTMQRPTFIRNHVQSSIHCVVYHKSSLGRVGKTCFFLRCSYVSCVFVHSAF